MGYQSLKFAYMNDIHSKIDEVLHTAQLTFVIITEINRCFIQEMYCGALPAGLAG